MLEIKDLSFSYPGSRTPVLEKISFRAKDGGITALLGVNGAGKSTLIKILSGALKPRSGSVLFDGADLLSMPPRKRASLIAYVPQTVSPSCLNVFETVLSARSSFFGFRPGQRDFEAVSQALNRAGIADLFDRPTIGLSGGELQRVAFARALAQEPKLLLFDEATVHLDPASETQIAGEIRRLCRERGVGVLFSLHDLNLAVSLCDDYVMLKNRRVLSSGDARRITEQLLTECYGVPIRIIVHEDQKYFVRG